VPSAAPAPASAPDDAMIAVVVPRRHVALAPRVEGKLRDVPVELGARVTAGQVVARLDDLALRAQLVAAQESLRAAAADHRRAASDLRQARRHARRRDALVREGVVAAEEADDAHFAETKAAQARDAADAQIARGEAQVAQLERDVAAAQLTAPFDGRVATIHVTPGAQVGAGQPVVTVISDEVLVRFAAPADRVSALAVGAAVRFRAGDVERTGRIVTIAPELDPAARMLFAEAELDPAQAAPAIHTIGRVAVVPPALGPAPGPATE